MAIIVLNLLEADPLVSDIVQVYHGGQVSVAIVVLSLLDSDPLSLTLPWFIMKVKYNSNTYPQPLGV